MAASSAILISFILPPRHQVRTKLTVGHNPPHGARGIHGRLSSLPSRTTEFLRILFSCAILNLRTLGRYCGPRVVPCRVTLNGDLVDTLFFFFSAAPNPLSASKLPSSPPQGVIIAGTPSPCRQLGARRGVYRCRGFNETVLVVWSIIHRQAWSHSSLSDRQLTFLPAFPLFFFFFFFVRVSLCILLLWG